MARQIVEIFGECCEIDVFQKSKTVWLATGGFMGSRLLTKGRSERAAVANWVKTAEIRRRR